MQKRKGRLVTFDFEWREEARDCLLQREGSERAKGVRENAIRKKRRTLFLRAFNPLGFFFMGVF